MNGHFLLRAYQEADSARTASIVLSLAGRGDVPEVTRAAIAAEWASRYPRHVGLTGNRSIRNRVSKRLSMLRLVRAVTVAGPVVAVGPDGEALQMIAANLAVVEAEDGVALPPSKWTAVPAVPELLRQDQADMLAGLRERRPLQIHAGADASDVAAMRVRE